MVFPYRKIKPVEIGLPPVPSITAPESDEQTFLDTMDRLYPDVARTAKSSIDVAGNIYNWANTDPDAFLSDLVVKGRTLDTETMLKGFGFKDEDIDEVLPEEPVLSDEETRRILKQGGVSEVEIEKIVSWNQADLSRKQAIAKGETHYWVESEKGWVPIKEPPSLKPEAPSLYLNPVSGEWTTQPPPPGVLGKISEALEVASGAPLFTIGGVGISAADIVGAGLIAYGSYQAATAGWNIFLKSSLLRNLNSWAKSAGIEIPGETKNSFINNAMANLSKKYLSQQAIKTLFRPTKAGFQASPETVRQAETEIGALVQREAPVFISRATQTGAMAFGGLPPQPGALTVAIWNGMTVAQRVAVAQAVGLEGTVGSKAFESLTEAEKLRLASGVPELATRVTPPTDFEAKLTAEFIKGQRQIPTVTPAPEVTKIQPTYENLTEGQNLVDQAGDRYTISKIEKEGVPARWAYTIKGITIPDFVQRRPLGDIERYYKIEQPITIPTAEPGMPEAGYQPVMFEEVLDREVRPRGKGELKQISMDDQLKLEQARRAAEEAPSQTQEAYEAQAEIEGLEITHQLDPVAQWRTEIAVTRRTKQPDGTYKLTTHKRKVGLDSFIDIKEQTFPEYFTVKQAEAIAPYPVGKWSKYTQKGLKTYNRVPRDEVLDELADKWNMTADEIADRVMAIRKENRQIKLAKDKIKQQMTERPLSALPEPTIEEVTENWQTLGQPKLTLKQVNALVGFFADYINDPTTVRAWELTRELRRETRAGRAESLKARAQQLIVEKGVTSEEAMKQAIRETLSGELPVVSTEYLADLTDGLRNALFAKVYHVLKNEPFEMASTVTALTNALTGKAIPREKPTPPPGGFRSRIWPQGASAYDKLQYVFGDQPKVLQAIDKMATEKKSLKDVVEGIYHETGREPIPIDQETADYLRSLENIPFGYKTLLEEPWQPPPPLPPDTRTARQKVLDLQAFKLELTPDTWKDWSPERLELLSYLRVNLLNEEYQLNLIKENWMPPPPVSDTRTAAQRALDLVLFKIEMAKPPIPVTRYEAPIEDGAKQIPLLPRPAKDNIIRILKEIGMSPVDIGNFLRANKASFDFSFWRQQAALIASHPVSFVQANIEAWKAMWSQKSAEASLQRITRRPLYQIYEEAETQGGDFLRPLELRKGTAQYKGVEEYGYPTGERLIPRLTAKIPWVKVSQRGFVTGTNEQNWLIFEGYYGAMLKLSEQYASGQKKLKVGEVFDVTKEMVDFAKSLANFTARGSLGKFAGAAPEIAGLFFAPRAAVGRILSVKDLINANPRVRTEAWKNAALFVSTFGGIVLLGAAMGWWSVEKDPRNAEYMSIRIGNTRIDPWGGYRQFVVFFTRAITGTGVSSVTGAEYEADPINLIQTFIRGKASPLASTILDFWRGKNFIGEEVDIANKAQWAERIAPFAVWDIYETWKDDPVHALQAAIPGILGAGVQTYTGDWRENFVKLGLPKYSDNLMYGLTEPYYDTRDFWADTASQFKGVDLVTLTEAKGYPEYIRAIAEALLIQDRLDILPNEKLVNLNADPAKGTIFTQYRWMWQDRQKIVDSGDEDKLKVFDQDERTRNAYLGNFSQRQFALLNEYWAITDKKKQDEFLKLHEAEIGTDMRDDYLRNNPSENAQLAIWQQSKPLTMEAYNQTISLMYKFDIPDKAIMDFLPAKDVVEVYFKLSDSRRSDVLKTGTTKAIADMYLEYSQLYDAGTPGAHGRGEDYRLAHPELQKWGEANLGWKPITRTTTGSTTEPGLGGLGELLR